MKYDRLTVAGHDICKVSFLHDAETLGEVVSQAKAKAPYTHRNNPSAKKRTLQEVFNDQLLGTLADKACCDLLQSYFNKYSPAPLAVERYDDIRTDEYKERDKFDARIVALDKGKALAEVEIRSSVCNQVSLARMINIWQVLGWYTTQDKPAETVRDLYMRPIYHYNLYNKGKRYETRDAEELLMSGALDLYIVGGATPHILETRGTVQEKFGLLQEGATYQVVDIKEAFGVGDFLKEAMNLCVSRLGL